MRFVDAVRLAAALVSLVAAALAQAESSSATATATSAGIQPASFDTERAWSEVRRHLPSLESLDALQNTTLLAVVFANSTERLESALSAQFEQLTSEDDRSHVTLSDLEQMYRRQYGLVRYYFEKWTQKLGRRIRREFAEMDRDRSGTVDRQEFLDALTPAFSSPIQVPAAYERVCQEFASRSFECLEKAPPSLNDVFRKEVSMLVDTQLSMCRSAFSWLANGFRTERCVLDIYESSKSGSTCNVAAMRLCFPHQTKQQQLEGVGGAENQTLSAAAPSESNSLEKRSVFAFPASFFVVELLAFPALTVIGALALLTSITFITAAAVASNHQVKSHWNENQNFERWQVGRPLPLCGTPILFWNNQCGALYSKRARNCTHGQLYHPDACVGWWTHGSRHCGFAGCQPLCMDIVSENCPKGYQPKLKLTYQAPGGYGLPVSV